MDFSIKLKILVCQRAFLENFQVDGRAHQNCYIFPSLRIIISNWIGLEGKTVKGIVEERAVELGEYIIENKTTVRGAAKKFGVSKSTVHKDVAQRLKYVDPQLYKKVKQILEINKAQRHIRGGMATRMKYKKD